MCAIAEASIAKRAASARLQSRKYPEMQPNTTAFVFLAPFFFTCITAIMNKTRKTRNVTGKIAQITVPKMLFKMRSKLFAANITANT